MLLPLILTVGAALAQETGLVVETYNVGLARTFVKATEDRAALLPLALAADDADVLCLQEVWLESDQDALAEALAATHPHTYALPVEPMRADRAPVCRRRELFGEGRFFTCLTGDCGGLEGDAFTACATSVCSPALRQLRDDNPQCANAVMAQVGKSALQGLWAIRRPLRRAHLFAYAGGDGLMLLSRVPLEDAGFVDFTDIATLNRRRALHATVRVDGVPTRVYCTHLTAMLDAIAPYPGSFETWEAESLAQVDRLLEHAAGFDGPTVLMGDFNSGPAVEGVLKAEAPGTHERIVGAGYLDPAVSLRLCTYCGTNPLINTDDAKLIDHVYLRGLAPGAGQRTHDGTVAGPDGKTLALSDHYGYSVRIGLPVPAQPPPQGPGPDPLPPEGAPPTEP